MVNIGLHLSGKNNQDSTASYLQKFDKIDIDSVDFGNGFRGEGIAKSV